MELDLSGKTAVITGAGRGIGETIALTFAEAGANIVAAARTESEIQATIDGVEAEGVDGLAVPTDLTSPDEIEELVERTVEEFGQSEILAGGANARGDERDDGREPPGDVPAQSALEPAVSRIGRRPRSHHQHSE